MAIYALMKMVKTSIKRYTAPWLALYCTYVHLGQILCLVFACVPDFKLHRRNHTIRLWSIFFDTYITHQHLDYGIPRAPHLISLDILTLTMLVIVWTASQHQAHVISSDDLWSVGPRRNRIAYHSPLQKLSTLLLDPAVLNYYGWSKHSRTMASTWRMWLSTVTMRALSRLLITQFSTRRETTSKFVIIFFVIICWRAASPSTMQALKTSWLISSLSPWMRKGFASYDVS